MRCPPSRNKRRGIAAVEFAVCVPILFLVLAGIWEVARITEVQQVMWNSVREAARDCSTGQTDFQTVANQLTTYLQSAEPGAFGYGHSTTLKAPTVTLPANTTGWMCWDTTANKELFTVTFRDLTNTAATDPTSMSQLDVYEVGIQVPYSSVGFQAVATITGKTRLYSNVTWASMQDSPYTITPYLPAH